MTNAERMNEIIMGGLSFDDQLVKSRELRDDIKRLSGDTAEFKELLNANTSETWIVNRRELVIKTVELMNSTNLHNYIDDLIKNKVV